MKALFFIVFYLLIRWNIQLGEFQCNKFLCCKWGANISDCWSTEDKPCTRATSALRRAVETKPLQSPLWALMMTRI